VLTHPYLQRFTLPVYFVTALAVGHDVVAWIRHDLVGRHLPIDIQVIDNPILDEPFPVERCGSDHQDDDDEIKPVVRGERLAAASMAVKRPSAVHVAASISVRHSERAA
jgi:hypothetical protein